MGTKQYIFCSKSWPRGRGGGGGGCLLGRPRWKVHPSHPPTTKLPLAVLFVFAATAASASAPAFAFAAASKMEEKKNLVEEFSHAYFFQSFISTCFEESL